MDIDMDVVDSLYDPTVDLDDDLDNDKIEVPGKKKKRKKKREATAKLDENDEFFENTAEKEVSEGDLIEHIVPPSFGGGHPYVAFLLDGGAEERQRMISEHVKWARMLSRDPESGVLVDGSYQVLRSDMKCEEGNLLVLRVNEERGVDGKTNKELLDEALETEPISNSPFTVLRWGLNTEEALLNIDTGTILDTTNLHEEDEDTSYLPKQWLEYETDFSPPAPYLAWCIDKTEGVSGLRKETRSEHLNYLKRSGRVISAGPLFEVSESDSPPIGSLVLLNARSLEDAESFVSSDPYNVAGLFDEVTVRRYNIADVSGKHGIKSKFEPDCIDPVEYEIEAEGEGKYDVDKTPWLV